MNTVLKRVFRVPSVLYRLRLGWLFGHRFLLLTHVGRRTGATRRTVLEVMRYDHQRGEAIVMSGFGPESDWFRNLEHGSPIEIGIGNQRFAASHRVLTEDDAVAVLADYERRNRCAILVVRRVLSALVGWRYDGSEDNRRRVVRQLPLIAFRRIERAD